MSEIKIGADGLIEHKLPLAYGYFFEYTDGSWRTLTNELDVEAALFEAKFMRKQHHPVRKVAIYAVD